MNLYMTYVLNCASKNLIPMPKQDWMQLGMPITYTDSEHIHWMKIVEPKEYEERFQLFQRIKNS